jgi:hypothetical protein
MVLHRGPDGLRLLGNSAVIMTVPTRMTTEAEGQHPDAMTVSYDLDKVIAVARGWQEKAAAAPDPAYSEACRRSAARFERLVTRSLDTPAIL